MIGEWVDADSLQGIILGAIVVLAALAALLLRVVRRTLLRLVLIVLIGALAASLWLERVDLQECVETCACKLFGQEVTLPADAEAACAQLARTDLGAAARP